MNDTFTHYNKEFSFTQHLQIVQGERAGINAKIYANPKLTPLTMQIIKKILIENKILREKLRKEHELRNEKQD